MATKIETGEYVQTRSELHLVDPRALVVDWTRNLSRGGQEIKLTEDVKSLGLDMMPKDSTGGASGQLHPIIVRIREDKRPEVIGGFRRTRAALWLIESGTCPDFKIKYVISRLNDAEAALSNLTENMHREDPNPIQLAFAIRALIEDYQMAMPEIAARLKRSSTYLNNLLLLCTLPKSIQKKVANKEVSASTAMELSKLPKGEAEAMIEETIIPVAAETVTDWKPRKEKKAKKLSAKKVKAAVKESKRKSGKKVARDIEELTAFLQARMQPEEYGNSIASDILDFLAGKTSPEDLLAAWNTCFETMEQVNEFADI